MKNKYRIAPRSDLVLLLDQFVAASLSYVLIFPLIFKKELILVVNVTSLISIYVFLLGATRILIVTNILDKRTLGKSPKYFLIQSLFLSSISILGIPASSYLNIDKKVSLLLCAFIFLALPQEIARQILISQDRVIEALGIDLLWMTSTIFTVYLLFTYDLIKLDLLICAWSLGALFSLGSGLILLRKEFKMSRIENNFNGVGLSSLALPVLTTLHTLSMNYFMVQNDKAEEIGLLRSIQFFFLPSIFLINIQQNYFVPSFTGANSEVLQDRKRKFSQSMILMTLVSGSISIAFLANNRFQYLTIELTIFVALSVAINSLIGRFTWLILVQKKVSSLILLRSIWLFMSVLAMFFIASNIVVLMIFQVIVDVLLYLGMRLSTSDFGRFK